MKERDRLRELVETHTQGNKTLEATIAELEEKLAKAKKKQPITGLMQPELGRRRGSWLVPRRFFAPEKKITLGVILRYTLLRKW